MMSQKAEADALPKREGDIIPVEQATELGGGHSNEKRSLQFAFGGAYPIGGWRLPVAYEEMEYSLNGREWSSAASGHGGLERVTADAGIQAQYLRATFSSGISDAELAAAREDAVFYAGVGYAAEQADAWTDLFHRQQGWTGSDGIYSIPFDGCETNGSAAGKNTLLLFGDTFIGKVDETTARRQVTEMINNTLAVLSGGSPDQDAIRFLWRSNDDGRPLSAITPNTEKGLQVDGSYYWLQDGLSLGGKAYCFPLIIGPNPDGPEGFQFAVHGVARVAMKLEENGPRLEEQEQTDTDLYYTAANGRTTYFGAAIMANTERAGIPAPDGYVYVYGLQNGERPAVVVARAPEKLFEDWTAWRYWDGSDWSADKEQVQPIAGEISCEYSVTPMGGQWDGAGYAVVFQEAGTGNRLSMYIGDSPVGPFRNPIRLFACPEPLEGKTNYVYNAKAHPHLSAEGELLSSYNVNATSMDSHMEDGGIYRPRFVNIRQIRPR